MYPYIIIELPSYVVMAFLGGIAALFLVYSRLTKYGFLFTDFLKIFAVSIVGGVAGSKLLFAITRIPWLIQNFSVMNLLWLIPGSGFVFYGGLFGVLSAIYLVTRKDLALQEKTFQMMVPAIPLFHCFGRIGCFMAGCCYGKELAEPITVVGIQLEQIPVQLIEALYEFLLFWVISIIGRKNPQINSLRIYLLSYSLFRFGIEFFRGDEIRGVFLGLSTAQWISIAIWIFYLVKKTRKANYN